MLLCSYITNKQTSPTLEHHSTSLASYITNIYQLQSITALHQLAKSPTNTNSRGSQHFTSQLHHQQIPTLEHHSTSLASYITNKYQLQKITALHQLATPPTNTNSRGSQHFTSQLHHQQIPTLEDHSTSLASYITNKYQLQKITALHQLATSPTNTNSRGSQHFTSQLHHQQIPTLEDHSTSLASYITNKYQLQRITALHQLATSPTNTNSRGSQHFTSQLHHQQLPTLEDHSTSLASYITNKYQLQRITALHQLATSPTNTNSRGSQHFTSQLHHQQIPTLEDHSTSLASYITNKYQLQRITALHQLATSPTNTNSRGSQHFTSQLHHQQIPTLEDHNTSLAQLHHQQLPTLEDHSTSLASYITKQIPTLEDHSTSLASYITNKYQLQRTTALHQLATSPTNTNSRGSQHFTSQLHHQQIPTLEHHSTSLASYITNKYQLQRITALHQLATSPTNTNSRGSQHFTSQLHHQQIPTLEHHSTSLASYITNIYQLQSITALHQLATSPTNTNSRASQHFTSQLHHQQIPTLEDHSTSLASYITNKYQLQSITALHQLAKSPTYTNSRASQHFTSQLHHQQITTLEHHSTSLASYITNIYQLQSITALHQLATSPTNTNSRGSQHFTSQLHHQQIQTLEDHSTSLASYITNKYQLQSITALHQLATSPTNTNSRGPQHFTSQLHHQQIPTLEDHSTSLASYITNKYQLQKMTALHQLATSPTNTNSRGSQHFTSQLNHQQIPTLEDHSTSLASYITNKYQLQRITALHQLATSPNKYQLQSITALHQLATSPTNTNSRASQHFTSQLHHQQIPTLEDHSTSLASYITNKYQLQRITALHQLATSPTNTNSRGSQHFTSQLHHQQIPTLEDHSTSLASYITNKYQLQRITALHQLATSPTNTNSRASQHFTSQLHHQQIPTLEDHSTSLASYITNKYQLQSITALHQLATSPTNTNSRGSQHFTSQLHHQQIPTLEDHSTSLASYITNKYQLQRITALHQLATSPTNTNSRASQHFTSQLHHQQIQTLEDHSTSLASYITNKYQLQRITALHQLATSPTNTNSRASQHFTSQLHHQQIPTLEDHSTSLASYITNKYQL